MDIVLAIHIIRDQIFGSYAERKEDVGALFFLFFMCLACVKLSYLKIQCLCAHMDMLSASKLTIAKVDDVLRIVEGATLLRRMEEPKHEVWNWLEKFSIHLQGHGVIAFLVMLIVAGLGFLFGSRSLLNTSFTIGVFASCLGFIILILLFVAMLPIVIRIVRSPKSIFVKVVLDYSRLNLPFINQLSTCDPVAIRYVLLQYKAERVALERRCAILAGPLDKIGLFPSLAAFVAVGAIILKVSGEMVHQLIYLVPAFYLIGFFAYINFQDLDRVIGLLELSLSESALEIK